MDLLIILAALVAGMLVGAIAMIIGPILATHLAQIIGKTYTFLVFTDREDLPITLNNQHYLLGQTDR